ncbi:MAG: hypothetical protein IJO57_02120, partial [Bacilli bacterium]|nr:hypothetical protein [Bacilli bacterium]
NNINNSINNSINKEESEKYTNQIYKIDKTDKQKILKLIKIFLGLSVALFILLFISGKFEMWMLELYGVIALILFEIMIQPRNKQIHIMKHNISRLFDVIAYTIIGIIFLLIVFGIMYYFIEIM